MNGNADDDQPENTEAGGVQELVPVCANHVSFRKDSGIEEPLLFPLFLDLVLIERCQEEGVLRMAFHTFLDRFILGEDLMRYECVFIGFRMAFNAADTFEMGQVVGQPFMFVQHIVDFPV